MAFNFTLPDRVVVGERFSIAIDLSGHTDSVEFVAQNLTVHVWNATALEATIHTSEAHNLTIRAEDGGRVAEASAIVDAWMPRPASFDQESTPDHQIRPGIRSSACTTNFLFTYQYERYFLGSAAHCVDESGDGTANGCANVSMPIGSEEWLEGDFQAILAYSAWESMNRVDEQDENNCRGNDFALLEIPEEWHHLVHPKAHGIVGHVKGLGDCRNMQDLAHDPQHGYTLHAYGRSSLRSGAHILSEPDREVDDKRGIFMADTYGGNSCRVYLLTQGIPGDSGGPLATVHGYALGAASTISLAGGSNNYVNIAAALELMHEYEGWSVSIVPSIGQS